MSQSRCCCGIRRPHRERCHRIARHRPDLKRFRFIFSLLSLPCGEPVSPEFSEDPNRFHRNRIFSLAAR